MSALFRSSRCRDENIKLFKLKTIVQKKLKPI